MEIALPSNGEALRYYAQLAHGTIARGYVCRTVNRPRGPTAWTAFGSEPELEGGSDRSRPLHSTCHGDIPENPPTLRRRRGVGRGVLVKIVGPKYVSLKYVGQKYVRKCSYANIRKG